MSLISDIANGVHDEDLVVISEAIRDRFKVVSMVKSARASFDFASGDMVRFNNRISPKYLQGAEATVVYIGNTGKVSVTMKHPIGKYSGMVTVFASSLEKVG